MKIKWLRLVAHQNYPIFFVVTFHVSVVARQKNSLTCLFKAFIDNSKNLFYVLESLLNYFFQTFAEKHQIFDLFDE